MTPRQITDGQKINVLQREVKRREREYPRQVRRGKMGKAAAEHELEVMYVILNDYLMCKELLQLTQGDAEVNDTVGELIDQLKARAPHAN